MVAISSLLVTLVLSLLVMRTGAVALMLTGLSRESARFQVRSAFTGAGFTTRESESVVNHPVRRRLIMTMMLAGNIGIATIVAAGIVSMLQTTKEETDVSVILLLASGLALFSLVAFNRTIERVLNRLILWSLKRWSRIEVRDYDSLLQLSNGYGVTEMLVHDDDWLAERTLRQLRLADEGVVVLGISRPDGSFRGAPKADMQIQPGDTLIVYGPMQRLEELDRRTVGNRGEKAHVEAVEALEVAEKGEEIAGS